MHYRRIDCQISETSLFEIVFNKYSPDMRRVSDDTTLLDRALQFRADKKETHVDNFSEAIIRQFDKSPIYGLKVEQVLHLNNYKIITDSNNNILIYTCGRDKIVRQLIFIYETDVYFSGSKMMAKLIEEITVINTAIEELYSHLDRDTKDMLKQIINDNHMRDSLKIRNRRKY